MGQFDRFKKGNDFVNSRIEPIMMNVQEGEKGTPGIVIPPKVETNSENTFDVNGGGQYKKLSRRAGDTVRTLQGRLRTPRSNVSPVFDNSNTRASKEGMTGPTQEQIDQDELKHLADIKSHNVTTSQVRGTTVYSRKGAAKPEINGHVIGAPLGNSKAELEASTSMRMDSTGDVYDQDELQVAQGEEISKAMDLQKKLTGDWRVRGAEVEARNAETKPGLDDSRRERKLARKRGNKATGFSGVFDKEGAPKALESKGDTGPKHVGERPIVGAEPVTKPLGSVVTEEKISDAAHDLRAEMTEGKDPDIMSTTMREHDIQGPEQMTGEYKPVYGPRETAPVVKTPVEKTGNVIPGRLLDTFGNAPVIDVEKEQIEANRRSKNRAPAGTRSTQFDPNKISARGTRGRTEGAVATDLSKLIERNAKLDAQGRGLTMHSPQVMAQARVYGKNAGLSEAAMNTAEFAQSEHVTRAYVEHASGASQEALKTYLGGRPLEAQSRLQAAYKTLNERERFHNTKEAGTGYTYSFDKPSVGQGKVDIENDYFKASNGEHVPMSNLSHPEHPLAGGKVMEGSHVPFKGFIPRGNGTYAHVSDIHHGWAPYNRDGKRVFEHHTIPQGAVHEADVISQAISTGTTMAQIAKQLAGGKETDVEVQGKALTPAPKAPIAGVRKEVLNSTPASNEQSPIDFPEGVEATAPSVAPRLSREAKLAKTHQGHLDSGTIKIGCKHCSILASKKSREDAADVAATFVPPTPPRAGSGSVMVKRPGQEAEIRPLTESESTAVQSVPSADDSKQIVGTAGAEAPKPTIPSFTPPSRKKDIDDVKNA